MFLFGIVHSVLKF